jgi:tetratricopeptide (TPR) repeat protein
MTVIGRQLLRAVMLSTILALPLLAQYVGSKACQKCHADKFALQSKSEHAHALAPGEKAQWAFGAGDKAITFVDQTGEETIAEHGLSYYTATKSMGITPGHADPSDIVYRTFDSLGTALRCFRCHSTGPVTLAANYKVTPSELGVRCESCHGPGSAHIQQSGAPGTIQNPKRLTPTELNLLCGACHRQASDLDHETDWTNPWNVRHQPSYLHRAACFRNSNGKLSCLTCHDPHGPLNKTASFYDSRCASCHKSVIHKTAIASRSCVSCHMPQVRTSATLEFTNHWIGIYGAQGKKLMPVRRMVKVLQPVPPITQGAASVVVPADPSTLVPVYRQALVYRERESGPNSAPAARASANLGLFLTKIGNHNAAEPPLRRALQIDRANSATAVDADCENLAAALTAQGKSEEALALLQEAASGKDANVAVRSLAGLAKLDPEHADSYYQSAIARQQSTSGTETRRLAVLLHEYGLALRAHNDDTAAEPVLRRALAAQEKVAEPDYHLTIEILNTLGNLLEGKHDFEEAEKLERAALRLAEEKFGPESADLATTCTYLADVLWNKKELPAAGALFRRAVSIDASLYGPERPETAADIANLGMLTKEAGQTAAGDLLLRQALAIYEKALGPYSAQAKFVRENLASGAR